MDLFDKKIIHPMFIGVEQEAFDSPDYIFELKLDGERGIAYLDPKDNAELRNKRNRDMRQTFPAERGISFVRTGRATWSVGF